MYQKKNHERHFRRQAEKRTHAISNKVSVRPIHLENSYSLTIGRLYSSDGYPRTRFYFGADFGFSNDPLAIVRCWIKNYRLYIDYEFYGVGIEINELERAFNTIPEIHGMWRIIADSARPDTISFLKQKGFNIEGAEKGKGSLEDGIEFLRGFEKIIIHPRCRGAIDNFDNYKWKQDKITNEILPIPAEGSDHIPDSLRYALEPYIKHKMSCFEALSVLDQ